MTYKKLIWMLVFLLGIFNASAMFSLQGFEDSQIIEFDGSISIFINEKNISITPLEPEELYIYNGKPSQEILESDQKLVYIIEHYAPDKKLEDTTRVDGQKRLTVVVKGAKVIIENGIIVKNDDNVKISTKSIFQTDSFDNREISFLSTKVTEIFGQIQELFFQLSDFSFSDDYDRGFFTGLATNYIPEIRNETFVEVIPNTECSKFGFVFYPDENYDYMDQTLEFTNKNGYALGIANSKNDNYDESLENMKLFVQEANKNNLTPIVRILGIDWFNEVSKTDDVVNFVKQLKKETKGKLEFIQIWDKPNLAYGPNNYFTNPQNYANYVIEIKNKLNDKEIKIISASLSIGTEEILSGENKSNSIEYLSTLLEYPEFWNSIDYWGSSAYNQDITLMNYCDFYNETMLFDGENLCLSSIYAYEKELELIYEKTNKQYKVFLTDTGYQLPHGSKDIDFLFTYLKEDPNVKASLIFLANGWSYYENSNWIDIKTEKITPIVNELTVCS